MKNINSFFFCLLLCFIACSGTASKGNNDAGKDKVSIIRFDKDFYNYLQNPNSLLQDSLQAKYVAFLPAFSYIVLNSNDSAGIFQNLKSHFSHPSLLKIYQDALGVFSDLTLYEDQLTEANSIVKQTLSPKGLPRFAIHVSGFKENVIVLNDLISISSDKYLGADYVYYPGFFEDFQRQQMQPKYLVRDYIKAWMMSDVMKAAPDQADLLSAIVNEGKILYAMSLILPQYEAKDLIGYTSEQLTWNQENEKNIWQIMVKNNDLFATDHMLITRYISDAPYTIPVSKSSPGRVGSWVGWQIVSQYAKKTGASLQDIIAIDAKTILKNSKYNP